MQKNSIPTRCRPCEYLWTGGIKNGVNDRWCCKYGNAAAKVQAQCLSSNGFKAKDVRP